MKRIIIDLNFSSKRNPNLITPCCGKRNRGSSGSLKFVNYVGLPEQFGYCHSCGKATLPPAIYEDENGNRFSYNEALRRYEKLTDFTPLTYLKNRKTQDAAEPSQRFIKEQTVIDSTIIKPENNLLLYLRKTYGDHKTNNVKEEYLIGTYNDGATMFWEINKNLKVQKCKLSYYQKNGRRTEKFNHIYTNKNGYYSCLFGEHLIVDSLKGKQLIVLVESEKTAIVGSILLPRYTWLAYGGKNGLNSVKLKCLAGHTVLIIPDLENEAVDIMKNKINEMHKIRINAHLWDMTAGRSNEELKKEGLYGKDIEDFFRDLPNF
ncbi:DUF6371 domain-containing protein [Winogradskyella tangerina]|uniref:DUF6371 domain-containing protein n=1 Tax=Winogradskyella tangerina TaxID=2023240 RepID=UPI000DBE9A35|nr:DUF6371 domain-containing protein [Winogradskyella tangerina]